VEEKFLKIIINGNEYKCPKEFDLNLTILYPGVSLGGNNGIKV